MLRLNISWCSRLFDFKNYLHRTENIHYNSHLLLQVTLGKSLPANCINSATPWELGNTNIIFLARFTILNFCQSKWPSSYDFQIMRDLHTDLSSFHPCPWKLDTQSTAEKSGKNMTSLDFLNCPQLDSFVSENWMHHPKPFFDPLDDVLSSKLILRGLSL